MKIKDVQGELTKLQLFLKEEIKILQEKLQPNDIRIGTLNKIGTRLGVLKLNFANLECLITNIEKHSFANHFEIITRFDCFIGIFSVFEDAILIILKKILDKGVFGKMFSSDLIYKIHNENSLIEYIKQNHEDVYKMLISEIPIATPSRKIDRLKGEKIIDENERNFLQFCLVLRNSMHSNGFYTGKDKEFEILGEKFKFKNNEQIKDITLTRYIKWLDEFIRIFITICKNTGEVFIPDNTLQV